MITKYLIPFFLLFSITAFTNEKQWQKIYSNYDSGNYEKVIDLLGKIKKKSLKSNKAKGLVHYMKALSYNRLSEYNKSLNHFEKTIRYKYVPKEIHYEYGQVLYTSNKLKQARNSFKKSVKSKFKVAVSLYYIASISEELRDYKTATTFYGAIDKVESEDKKRIQQAAKAKIADIFLMQAKKQSNASEIIEKFVIPQYQSAYDVNSTTALAVDIKEKIEKLQRRYELVLFNLRNGRPTARPPYFYKLNMLTGFNSNVNETDDDSIEDLDSSEHAAAYTTVGFFGRYTFYPNTSYSLAPQINVGYTKYFSDEDSIKVANNYFITTSLQATLEHFYSKRAATFFLNLDYTYSADDADADDEVEKASDTKAVTLSEQLELMKGNPTIFRYKYSLFEGLEETENYTTHSMIVEQMINTSNLMYYLTLRYSTETYDESETQDNTEISFRSDFIFSPRWNGITPNPYFSRTMTDYSDSEGVDRNFNTLGLNISKTFDKHWYAYIDYGYSFGDSAVEDTAYSQQVIQFNVDYIF